MRMNGRGHFLDTRLRRALTAGVLACGVSIGAMSADIASTSAREATSVVVAKTAHVENVSLKMNLEITAIKGNKIQAQGQITGKFFGTVSLQLNLVNASHAVATFTGYNSHGKLYGSGGAGYRVSGSISYFNGGNPSLSGSGKYAGTKSDGMTMTGTMNRRTLKIAINLNGKLVQ
jgi:hypothetical protein